MGDQDFLSSPSDKLQPSGVNRESAILPLGSETTLSPTATPDSRRQDAPCPRSGGHEAFLQTRSLFSAEADQRGPPWRSALVGTPGNEDLWRIALVGRPPDVRNDPLLRSQSCSSIQWSQSVSPVDRNASTAAVLPQNSEPSLPKQSSPRKSLAHWQLGLVPDASEWH